MPIEREWRRLDRNKELFLFKQLCWLLGKVTDGSNDFWLKIWSDDLGGTIRIPVITFKRVDKVQADVITLECNTDDFDKDYRFGFNGQVKDNKLKGIGNSLDFGERIDDTRLGRFLSLDPLANKFPWQSPYVFAGNSPIKFIDKKGLLQLDPGILKDYPLIHKYLSTQIENDVMTNTKIIDAYKMINPDVTDANIRTIFKDGSGPVLYDIYNPGGYDEAAGHLNYNRILSSIEINTKIFDHVEKVLKESENPSERLKATLFLFQEITHEAGHEVMGYKNGEIVSEYEQRERSGNFSYGEDGKKFEKAVWGTRRT